MMSDKEYVFRYVIVEDFNAKYVSMEVTKLLNEGMSLSGPLTFNAGRYVQVVFSMNSILKPPAKPPPYPDLP